MDESRINILFRNITLHGDMILRKQIRKLTCPNKSDQCDNASAACTGTLIIENRCVGLSLHP